jgi:hypothetical protein
MPREVDLTRERRSVARVTYEVRVSPVEGEIGLCIVIETPERPTVRIVALLAGGSQPLEVNIFCLVAADAADLGVLESRRDVALLASRHRVKTQQREPRQIVIEEDARRPLALVMALLACGPFLSPVDIVRPVAGVAGSVQRLLIQRPYVTPLTSDVPVCTPKRKFRQLIVVEDFGFPSRFAVASLTIRSVAPAVLVVRAVAANAKRRELPLQDASRMTRLAGGHAVAALERELRTPIVIEPRGLPSLSGMTRLAVRSKATEMSVIQPVAAMAVRRRVLVPLSRMAERTIHVAMFPIEGKPGGSVIETRFRPRPLNVTFAAASPQLPIVHVFAPMAVAAFIGCLAVLLAECVAALTDGAQVAAFQRVIGEIVIEDFPIELDHVALSAFVLGMTAPAVRFCGARCAAVKPG